MKKGIFIILAILIQTSIFSQSNYETIVATDFDGNVVSGSIDSLISEIRKGKPVRVGWQLDFDKDKKPDFDHWVDAGFLTILGGHVFAQIETIYIQGPRAEIPQVEIYPTHHQWTALIGTNGKLLNRFIMEKPPKMVDKDGNEMDEEAMEKRFKEMTKVDTWKVATFWSVLK